MPFPAVCRYASCWRTCFVLLSLSAVWRINEYTGWRMKSGTFQLCMVVDFFSVPRCIVCCFWLFMSGYIDVLWLVSEDITFDSAVSPQHIFMHTDALIKCVVSGRPSPEVQWIYHGRHIRPGLSQACSTVQTHTETTHKQTCRYRLGLTVIGVDPRGLRVPPLIFC